MNKDLKNYILALAEKKLRNSGKRNLMDFRNLVVETGISKNAEGSARVRLGKTMVLAGVKMSIGTPYPDTPNKGNLICSAELNPIADNEFEPGPPREGAIELSRVVDRGIREGDVVDFEKLCITEGEKVWNIFVDIYVFNNDGNLIDACGIAAISALKSARMPKLDKEGKVLHGEWSDERVPFKKTTIPTTFAKIDNTLIVDPDKTEEEVMSARLTITCSEKEVNAMQKGGSGGFTVKEIEKCVEESFKIREKIVGIIKKIK